MTVKLFAAVSTVALMLSAGAAIAQTTNNSETLPTSQCDGEKGSAAGCESNNTADPADVNTSSGTVIDSSQCDGEKGSAQGCDNDANNDPSDVTIKPADPAKALCDGEKGSSPECTDGNSNTN